ncbi:hypothetical protein NKJ73_27335 [Mesorhizobium sp. M0074]|uniref:hypothetical protein n=1 Tax=Mesorhizobium sp. M0074 TaxID=2956869 RepID=UPI0033380BE5
MPVLRSKQFFKREHGQGDEHWYRLCFETETGKFFVHEEFSVKSGGVFVDGEREVEMSEFMKGGGDRQNSLIEFVKKGLF